MPRRRVAAHEPEAVRGDELPFLDRHRSPLGIGDLRADVERRLFAAPGEFRPVIDRQPPRVVKVQIGEALLAAGQQAGVRQSGAVVFGGEAGDVERRLHRLAQGGCGKIRGTGVSLALAEIDGDADPLVAVVFDGLDFAATNADRLPESFGDIDLAVAGAGFPGVVQHILGVGAQRIERMREPRVGVLRSGFS
ncbi:hypothetical protein SDC9_179542 [bioreactor metagenome]|uniref:Uncharacterized protein n=1 Tax=bioreactor metagenome TaxID=1076179 RepID=A0A645H0R6_9ZZZZ